MAKRFTDSSKWVDPWFNDLPNKYKLFYLYLIDTCDHAGVWKVNFKLAQFMVGESLEPSEVKRILDSRVRFLSDEYWFIEKFIAFQYGTINNDKLSLSILKILNKFNLQDVIEHYHQGASKPLGSPYVGGKDKSKDKSKDKDKSKIKKNLTPACAHEDNISENAEPAKPTIEQCQQVAEMAGHDPRYGEAYFNMRDRDGWTRSAGKGEHMQMVPIANYRSDYAHVYSQGYLKIPENNGRDEGVASREVL
jgi:hypothetical protein